MTKIVLLSRYFSNAILDSIHRSIAIEEWYRLGLNGHSLNAHVADQRDQRLERSLGAFDMFVLHDQPGDIDDVWFPSACQSVAIVPVSSILTGCD